MKPTALDCPSFMWARTYLSVTALMLLLTHAQAPVSSVLVGWPSSCERSSGKREPANTNCSGLGVSRSRSFLLAAELDIVTPHERVLASTIQFPPMNIAEAQRDMRHAYYGGATGLLASATAWLVAGFFAAVSSPGTAIAALLVGGVLIYPVSVIFAKALGRPGSHTRGNPLGALALEGTFFLLLAIPLAYAVSLYRVEWFFPAMLLLIGGRYLTFTTIYGMRQYWACGTALALVGFLMVLSRAPFLVGAFAGALIEYVFAAVVFAAMQNTRPAPADHAA